MGNAQYPTEIPFTEYSLVSTSCQWTNFDSDTVIVINSDNELENYIVCTDGSYPDVDFSQYTLLLTRGWSTSGINHIDIAFKESTVNQYALDITIHTNMTAEAPPWWVSIVVPKMDNDAIITLNVQQINNN